METVKVKLKNGKEVPVAKPTAEKMVKAGMGEVVEKKKEQKAAPKTKERKAKPQTKAKAPPKGKGNITTKSVNSGD